ncbi:unnamed protein product [Enterobius vermicularis]|uniref:Tellurite resistance TerB family protein n=1 Tax=Enterobius vermicularis TaxID=51028 RepID=A0A0N4V5T5_ENTVE|nr:unnamed protein product [Enterobius vermicularis]
MIGQSFTNALSPAIEQLKQMPDPTKSASLEPLPSMGSSPENLPGGALIGLARAFLGSGDAAHQPQQPTAFGVKQVEYEKDPIPTLKDIAPVARNNFGMPMGKKTWDTWGGQISNVLLGGKVDFLQAARETCKRGAERTQCGQLRKAISECDIMGSVQIALELQRAMQRCEEVSGIIDQNPMQVLDQVNGVIGSEVAQGFLHKFLG